MSKIKFYEDSAKTNQVYPELDPEEMAQKANIDGYYEEMAVGVADNLSSRGDGVPALFRRRTAGGDADIADGNALLDKIKGKSIVWNQLVRFWNQSTEHYQCTVDENQIYTLTYDTTGYETFTYVTLGLVPGQGNNNNRYGYLNHIFYVRYNIIEQSGTAISRSYINTTTQNNIFPRGLAKDVYGRAYVSLYLALPSNASGSMKFTVSVFDLTKMFGSGNEPTMDEFDYLFPDNINAVEQGTIVNLNNCSLQTTGFNQWDEEWEQGQIEYNKASANWGKNKATAHGIRSKNYIPVFNQAYHCYLGSGAGNVVVLFYDENHNPIANQDLGYKVVGNTTFDILPRTKYIRFYCTAEYGDTYKNDICINLSWSGYRDGEYEEYWDYNRELPINTYFPEGMKSTPVAYDELTENRAISRVGTMVLDGSNDENWIEVPTMSEGYKAYKLDNIATIYPDLEVGNYAQFKNRITYNDYSYEEFSNTMSPYTFSLYNIPTGSAYNWLLFGGGNIEELNSVSKLRTLLQSRPLVINYVKKEAVTTEIETPLNLSYKVSDFGTEEVLFENNDISKMGIMNADIIYGMNASDTLRRLPINYVSKSSMDNFLGELSNSTQSNWTAEYNDETGVYDYETDLDLSKKANVDGYYEEMTVGAADNLSGKDTGVPANFTFRTSGGDEDVADGMATISEIRGNTILWNQLVSTTTDLTTDYYTKTYDATTKEITITWDTTGAESTIYVTVCGIGNNANNQLGYNNHLFYVRPTYSIRTMDDFTLYINTSQQNNCKDGAFTRINQKTYTTLNMGLSKDTTGSLKFRINVFDLTKMFGIDNEPSTPAEFNSLFPLSYYDYNDGSLLNYTGTSLQTVGFNQWDEEWETGQIWYDKDDPNWGQNRPSSAGIRSKNYIPVFNQAYYCAKLSTSPVYALCYDENYNPIINPNNGLGYINIANTQVTWFPGTKYIRFYTPADYGSIYRNDICINIAWSGYRNGEYEEYWSRNESIDFSEYFPQGMASVYKRNGNNLSPTYIYDSVTKEKAIKRTKSYTFTGAESENWSTTPNQASTDTYIFRIFNLSDCSHQYSTGIVPTKNSYGWVGDQSIWDKSVNFEGVMLQSNNSCLMFRIRKDKLSEESVAALKTYLSSHPLTIIYEINQYIETEFEEPLRLNYKVSDFGTEKILPENTSTPTTSPFNGNIAYGINASDTIRRLPENYMSEESMEAFLSALNTATNGTWTMTYNSETGKYGFTFTPNQN